MFKNGNLHSAVCLETIRMANGNSVLLDFDGQWPWETRNTEPQPEEGPDGGSEANSEKDLSHDSEEDYEEE